MTSAQMDFFGPLALVVCLGLSARAPGEESKAPTDRAFFDGVFAGEAALAEPAVEERLTLYDGPLPTDRDSSFWSLYEKGWHKHVSEKDVFNALLRRFDKEGNTSWEIGIGNGGQLYSWRGAWGEAIPPQAAPWMDEVWQATLHSGEVQTLLRAIYEYDDNQSNGTNSVGQAFVHGSGSSNKYGAKGDAPYSMFFCPMLARWYDEEEKAYTVVNLGQSPTQPTIFPHKILFYSRYRYLGQGVLEVSNALFNFGSYTYGYNGTPWGGVRYSTFPERFRSRSDGSVYFEDTMIRFGHKGAYMPPKETDGWLGAAAAKDDAKTHAFAFIYGIQVNSCAMGTAGAGGMRDYIVMASNPPSSGEPLSEGRSFWNRYYLAVGALTDVVAKARKYESTAGSGDLDLPEDQGSLQTLYRGARGDGTVTLSRTPSAGAEAVCQVYNEPVRHAKPLFVVRERPTGRSIVTTNPYELSRREPYPNPLPKEHKLHEKLQGAEKRYTYESESGKKLAWELLGFVMPKTKASRALKDYMELETLVTSPGTRGMLALGSDRRDDRPAAEGRAKSRGVPKRDPEYSFSPLSAPDEVKANETFVVTSAVRNTGQNQGSRMLDFFVDSQKVQSTRLRLAPGQEKEIAFEASCFEPGNHEIAIGTSRKTVRVQKRPATFICTALTFPDEIQYAGEEITVSATVANMGSEPGAGSVSLFVNGEAVDTREVSSAAGPGGVKKEVTFACRFDKAGTHSISCGGLAPVTVDIWDRLSAPFSTYGIKSACNGQRHGGFVIRAAGRDVWECRDKKHDEYSAIAGNKVSGDYTAVVKLAAMDAADLYAKAGLMVRNDLSQPARAKGYAALSVVPEMGLVFLADSDGNGYLNQVSEFAQSIPVELPAWLKIERRKTRVSAFCSKGGRRWRRLGYADLPSIAASQHVGLFASARSATEHCRAVFGDLDISTPPDDGAPTDTLPATDNKVTRTVVKGGPVKPDALGRDISRTAAVTVSSAYLIQPHFSGRNATDGNMKTEWASACEGAAAWMALGFDKPQIITHVAYKGRQADCDLVRRFALTFSDGSTQTCVMDPASARAFQYFDIDDITTTSVRWDALDAGDSNVGAREFAVYADPSSIPVKARGEHAPKEPAEHAFDGSLHTKWLDFAPKGSWIQYDYGKEEKTVSRYSITSANDEPPRDPRDWRLLGSHDGKAWTTLDKRKSEKWAKRHEKREFRIENNESYRIYRLDISAVRGEENADAVQIAEIELLPQTSSEKEKNHAGNRREEPARE